MGITKENMPNHELIEVRECPEITDKRLLSFHIKTNFITLEARGNIIIDYVPDQLCLDAFLFPTYLETFKKYEDSVENCLNRVANDIITCIYPIQLRIETQFAIEGYEGKYCPVLQWKRSK